MNGHTTQNLTVLDDNLVTTHGIIVRRHGNDVLSTFIRDSIAKIVVNRDVNSYILRILIDTTHGSHNLELMTVVHRIISTQILTQGDSTNRALISKIHCRILV